MKEKRVLVIGLGLSGLSAARFLLQKGAVVTGVDRKADMAMCDASVIELCSAGMKFYPESEVQVISQFDLVVVSPGVPQTHSLYQQALNNGIEVIGEVELACREMKQKCAAITGTNGKTTVTLLTTHVLNKAGKKARALGNVGTPLTSAIGDGEADIFVIELSSFQLETIKHCFVDVGVILNITPDHLDRYPSMKEYALAKIRMKDVLLPAGKLVVEERCLQEHRALFGEGEFLSYGYSEKSHIYSNTQDVCCKGIKTFSLPQAYRGKQSHDLENVMAAYALCHHFGVTGDQFLNALSSFEKPAHRVQFVRTVSDVHYYDDSKGTNIDAVMRAVDSLGKNIVLIAGGIDKGAPYTSWISAFNGKVKSICAIGQSANKIKNELEPHIPVELFVSLSDAVVHASRIACSGDTVLLSPGCSSYDMFRDYAHRGEEFQRIVKAL